MKHLLALGVLWLVACDGPAPRPLQARVTFVVDDGRATDISVKVPIFRRHGAVGVLAFPTRFRRQLADSHLVRLQREGWEIAAHTRNHPHLRTLSDSALEDEIGGSKADLEAMGIRTPNFVYPYGEFDARVKAVVRRHFASGVDASGGMNERPIADPYAVRRVIFGADYVNPGQGSLEYFESLVDHTWVEGEWLVFNVHELTADDRVELGKLLDYIHTLGIPIVTLEQGMKLFQ